jgi:hypothetical protein
LNYVNGQAFNRKEREEPRKGREAKRRIPTFPEVFLCDVPAALALFAVKSFLNSLPKKCLGRLGRQVIFNQKSTISLLYQT